MSKTWLELRQTKANQVLLRTHVKLPRRQADRPFKMLCERKEELTWDAGVLNGHRANGVASAADGAVHNVEHMYFPFQVDYSIVEKTKSTLRAKAIALRKRIVVPL